MDDNVVTKTVTPEQGFDVKRQMHGTAFLSLEHWAYMTLVVVMPLLILGGFHAALAVWTNKGSDPLSALILNGLGGQLAVSLTILFTAMLLVLAPMMFILQRRTQSEFVRRPGYKDRAAYKLPIYGALAGLALLKVAAVIAMLAAFLQSIAWIGVDGADIGRLYLTEFLPALLATVVFLAAEIYVFKLAKGLDRSRMFTFVVVALAAVVALALLITGIVSAHNPERGSELPLLQQLQQTSPNFFQ